MTKKFLTLALAFLGICGLSAMAQQNDNNECSKNQCQQNAGYNNKMYQPQTFTDFAFEGILLDVNQQAAIDSLNAAMLPNGPQQCDKQQCDKQQCDKQQCDKQQCDKQQCDKQQCDKQQCDSTARRQHMRHQRPNAQGCPINSDYIEQVKAILTPDQYVIFLENIVNCPMNQRQQMCPREHKQYRGEQAVQKRHKGEKGNKESDKNCQKRQKKDKK